MSVLCIEPTRAEAAARYTAHLETLCSHASVARVFERPNRYGDPYVWACVVRTEGWLATVEGVCRTPTPEIREALYAALRDAGFTVVRYERRSGANPGWRTHEL